MGKPRLWASCSSLKVKIRVSDETETLAWSSALCQTLVSRKTGRGEEEPEGASGSPSERMRREASSNEPMWYVGIIALAVSLSTGNRTVSKMRKMQKMGRIKNRTYE